MKLNEVSIIEGAAESNVFRNVKILGKTSRNGYQYPTKTVEQAVVKYNGVAVYIDHVGRNQPSLNRSYRDRVGRIENARVQEGEVFGDVVLNPFHPSYQAVLWDAEQKTNGVGFSHSIECAVNNKTKVVESIDRVYSVDIVDSPSTTISIFEQEDKDQDEHTKELVDLKEQVATLKTVTETLSQQLSQIAKVKPVALPPASPAAPVQDNYETWLAKMRA